MKTLLNIEETPDVVWHPDFLTKEEEQALFDFCKNEVEWKDPSRESEGKWAKFPRLLAWFGDVGYAYSGIEHAAHPMPPQIAVLMAKVEQDLMSHGILAKFNSVLLNYYRDGDDSISPHSDDESSLEVGAPIASVSLGAARRFTFYGKTKAKPKIDYHLNGGSLLVMKGETQKHWRHGVAKEAGAAPRINLTFRSTR